MKKNINNLNNDNDLLFDTLISGRTLSDYKELKELQNNPILQYLEPTRDDYLSDYVMSNYDDILGSNELEDYEEYEQPSRDDVIQDWIINKDYNLNNNIHQEGGSFWDTIKSDTKEGAGKLDLSKYAGMAGTAVGGIINNLSYDEHEREYVDAIGNTADDPLMRLAKNIGGGTTDDAISKLDDEIGNIMSITEQASKPVNFTIGDNTSLMSQYDSFLKNQGLFNFDSKQNINERDPGSRIFDNLNAFGQGAMQGSIGGPWAALAGGIVGGLANIGSLIFEEDNRKKINNKIDEYNQSLKDLELAQLQAFAKSNILFGETAANSAKLNTLNQLYNMAAYGGKLKTKKHRFDMGGYLNSHSNYFDDPLIKVEAGGTHLENPNEGVQVSVAPDGQPNLVEEGETIYNDYVYSNRIYADEQILKDNLIDDKYKGKTYSDISKELSLEIEERKDDPISIRTHEENMERLKNAQEALKLKGKLEEVKKFIDSLTEEQKLALEERMMQEYQAELEALAQQLQEYAMQQQQYQELQPQYELPRQLNEIQYKHGGNLHQEGGDINNFKYWNKETNSYDLGYLDWLDSNEFDLNDPRLGYIKTLYDNLTIDDLRRYGKDKSYDNIHLYMQDRYDEYLLSNANKEITQTIVTPTGTTSPTVTTTEYSPNLGWLRFAPIVGSLGQVLMDAFGYTNTTRPSDYSNTELFQNQIDAIPNVGFTPIGGYQTFRPFDETYQLNVLRAVNAANRRAIENASNGSAAAALANLSAMNYQNNNQLGNLALQAREYNDKQRMAVAEFNSNIDRINASLSLSAQEKNLAIAAQKAKLYGDLAQMRENIKNTTENLRLANEAAKAANYLNLFENIGALGRESFNMGMVNSNPAYYYRIKNGKIQYKNGFDNLPEEYKDYIRSIAEKELNK